MLDAAFDLTELEVLRNRVLVAEQALVGLHRTSPREEEARQLARRACATSSSPGPRSSRAAWSRARSREADPRLLARAILGLYNSVWHWYRPRGNLSLDEVRDFYVDRCLAVAGLPAVAPAPAKGSAPAQRRPARKAA